MIADAGPCNIEVRDASITQFEFLDRYIFINAVLFALPQNVMKFQFSFRKFYVSFSGKNILTLIIYLEIA